MPAFEFRETMFGSFEPTDRPHEQRAMSFTIRARSRGFVAFLRERVVDIEGEVDVEGFADHRYMKGTLGLDVIRTGTLPYAFEFTDNAGAVHVFQGKKTLSAAELAQSMTVLPGVVRDAAGNEVGRALLRFDVRSDLVRFLRSFRAIA
jgi:hypothetical protein